MSGQGVGKEGSGVQECEGTCHYDGDLCANCKRLAEKYDGWEPWEDATWD